MANPSSATILNSTPSRYIQPGVSATELPPTDGGIVEVGDFTLGMVDNLPREKTPHKSAKIITNGRVRDNWCGRREGTDEVGTKPDSNRVIGLTSFVDEAIHRFVFRITQSTVHVWNGASWSAYTINDGGFIGAPTRVSVSQLFGKLYAAFGYSNDVWEIDPTGSVVNKVDDAPKAKFSITFADRIMLANLSETIGGPRPNKVAWSANSDPLDWDAESAGEEDLFATDLGNEITGFVALENVAAIVRRKSIVLISRQPFALAPFRFDTVVSGMGSDLPYTTVRVSVGIIFADSTTQDVYLFRPGSLPASLTGKSSKESPRIYRQLYEDLANAKNAEASFDPYEGEYHLGLSWTTDDDIIRRHWVCNISGGVPVWSYDDGPVLTTLSVVLPISDPTTINELAGTINALTGSIDSLSTNESPSPSLFGGTSTGEVIEYSFDHATDWDATAFEFLVQSQNLGSISRRRVLKDLELTCSIPVTGNVTIEESSDESTWRNTKTASYTGASTLQKVRLPKTQISGDDLFWRVKATASQFRILSWWGRIMEKGQQVGGAQI